MASTRRDFLKNSAIAGAALTMSNPKRATAQDPQRQLPTPRAMELSSPALHSTSYFPKFWIRRGKRQYWQPGASPTAGRSALRCSRAPLVPCSELASWPRKRVWRTRITRTFSSSREGAKQACRCAFRTGGRALRIARCATRPLERWEAAGLSAGWPTAGRR